MAISMSKTREMFPLSQKKPLKKTISSSVGTILGLIIMGVFIVVPMYFSLMTENKTTVTFINSLIGSISPFIIITIILLVLLNYFYQVLYFNSYYYEITNDFIIIKKGVITIREITVPFERIQDVYVDQDLFDRIFGLFDVHISSATLSSGFSAHIDGVEKPAADGLRNKLLEIVSEKLKGPSVNQPVINQPTAA